MTKRSIILMSGIVLVALVFLISGKEKVEKNDFSCSRINDSIYYDVQNEISVSRSHELDSIFKRYNKKGIFNGTVLYAENGNVVLSKAYGHSNFRKKDSLTTSSSFQLASVSKMFTAMAIMILKEQGFLAYDDSLNKYIPELPYYGITIRHLLHHRSGLPRYMSMTDKYWDVSKPINNEDVIQLFTQYYPDKYYRPDQRFHYCNTNYMLLASVVERISGKTFDVFAKENIFDPLKMENSFVYHLRDDSLVHYRVEAGTPGYRSRGWRIIEVGDYYLNGVMGDKGVYSSAEDLFRFNKALDNGSVISLSSLEEAFAPGNNRIQKQRDDYGFGWRIKADKDSTAYHFGWWKGFRTYFIRDMKNQRALIVLSNTHRGLSSKVLWDIIKDENRSEELLTIYHKLD